MIEVNKMSPQNSKMLDLMRRDGTVTRLTAMHYGISNPTARIADLRIRHGINIRCQRRVDATGQRYGAWHLA